MPSTPPSFGTITRIEIDYDGSGDSGGIDTITAFNNDTKEVILSGPQKRCVRERVLDILPDGFENNEGGFGTIVIELADNTLMLYHNNREWEDQESSHDLSRAEAGALRSLIPRPMLRSWRQQGVVELRVQLIADDLQAEVLFLDRDGRVVVVPEADGLPDTLVNVWYEHLDSEFPHPDDGSEGTLSWSFCLGLDHRRRSPLRPVDQSPWGSVDLGWSELDSAQLPRETFEFLPADECHEIPSSTPESPRATA
jgi:hypothetical protein